MPSNWPDIIRMASQSNLGILALMIMLLALLALVFFKKAETKVKLLIFATAFVGVFCYARAVTNAVDAMVGAGVPSSFEVEDAYMDASIDASGKVLTGEMHASVKVRGSSPLHIAFFQTFCRAYNGSGWDDGWKKIDLAPNSTKVLNCPLSGRGPEDHEPELAIEIAYQDDSNRTASQKWCYVGTGLDRKHLTAQSTDRCIFPPHSSPF